MRIAGSPARDILVLDTGTEITKKMKPRIFLCILCLVVSSEAFTQADLFTISEDNVPLRKIIRIIKSTGKYGFWYKKELLQHTDRVTVHVHKRPIGDVMDQALRGLYLNYELIGDSIVVLKRTQTPYQQTTTYISVAGKVMNEDGEALPGVSVTVHQSTRGTATDVSGAFSLLNLHPGTVLDFSYVGYQSVRVPVRDGRRIELKMKSAAVRNLDETVIIGYGKTTPRYNTGSVYKVRSSEISNHPVSNPLAVLQARVPGLLITQANGLPGTAFKVQLRGQSSIGITPGELPPNDPLFIIDGVPFGPNNASLVTVTSGTALGTNGRSPMTVINPSDIESIEILKDADATAIYGSRGANGVVLITMKKAKAGKPAISANVYTGASRITRHIDVLNTPQYVEMRLQAFRNDGLIPNATNAPDLTVWDTTRYTNFKDMLIGNTATMTNLQMSLTGGTNKLHYLIGTGYNHETTVFPGSLADNRASLHMHLKHNSEGNRFTAGFTFLYARDKNNSIVRDITEYIFLAPNTPKLYDSVGNLNWHQGGKAFVNPIGYLRQPYETRTGNLILALDLNYHINKNLVFRSNLGYNHLSSDEITLIPKSTLDTYTTPSVKGSSFFGNTTYSSQIFEPQLEYTAYIKNSTLAVMVGTTIQRTTNNNDRIVATGFEDDALLRNASEAAKIDSVYERFDYKYAAIFARLHYQLDNTYIVNLTARRDGSSRFGPSRQFGNFGAVGAAWIFSNNSFFKDKLKALSFGKLRASYGITGNDRIGDYKYLDKWLIMPNGYLGSPGMIPIQLADDDYSWEVSRKLELAMELGLFKDQVQVNIAWFRNRNSNQLIAYPLPLITGFGKYEAKNSGAVVQNTGFEIVLRAQSKPGKRFGWTNSLALTIPRNKLVAFPNLQSSVYANNLFVGESMSAIKGLQYIGLDANNVFDFEDIDGDGNVSFPEDYRILGNRDPQWYAGIQNNFNYKNWQFDLLWEIRKQRGYNHLYTIYRERPPGELYYNQPENIFDGTYQSYSVGGNTVANTAIDNFLLSNGILSDASYLRLKNISVSFSLPQRWQQKMSLKNFRIYIRAQNLLTFTSFYGSDPETQNIKTLPPLKTIVGGIEMSF